MSRDLLFPRPIKVGALQLQMVTLIIGLRLAIAIASPLLIILDQSGWAFMLLLIAVFSDFLDGYVGRRYPQTSLFGPFGDAIVDFGLVFSTSTAFALKDVYPWWILLLLLVMFGQFLLTSQRFRPIYDPIGKYFGFTLFAIIGMTLLWPTYEVALVGQAMMIAFTMLTLVSRWLYFKNEVGR